MTAAWVPREGFEVLELEYVQADVVRQHLGLALEHIRGLMAEIATQATALREAREALGECVLWVTRRTYPADKARKAIADIDAALGRASHEGGELEPWEEANKAVADLGTKASARRRSGTVKRAALGGGE